MTIATWELLDQATYIRKKLLHAGYCPVPARGKVPPPGWNKMPATEATIDQWAKDHRDALNTGILSRATPGFDIDIPDAAAADGVEELARGMLEERGRIVVRFGNAPKRLIPLRADVPFKKMKLALLAPNDAKAEIEILGDGQQFIAAGVHPDTRRPYSWHGGELWTVPHEDLPYCNEQQAREFLKAAELLLVTEFGYKPVSAPNGHGTDGTADTVFDELYGSSADWRELITRIRSGVELHDSLCALAMSAVANGMNESATVRMLEALMQECTAPHDERWQERYDDISRTVASAVKKRAADTASGRAAHSWDEPDASLLDDRRGELPDFPLDTFPPDAADWIAGAADGAGVSAAHVAVPLLGIASGLIGVARRVMASRSYRQPAAMWVALVGASGSGKTPGLDCVKRPLAMIEAQRKNSVAELQHAHEARVEAAKAARAVWKKDVEAAASAAPSAKKTIPMPPDAIVPPPFVAPRLFVVDSTIERLAVLLTARPRGLLLIGDELAALFLNMGRYSSGSDREFWLEAWNGGAHTIERQGREPVRLDHLLVGMTGGLQPDKLARTLSGDLDGLYARMLFAWPEKRAYRPLDDVSEECAPEIINALARLVDIDDGGAEAFIPLPIPLTREARAVFETYREQTFRELDAHDEGRERDWLCKGEAHVLRLAITLEYLDWAFRGGAEPQGIGERSVSAAVRLVAEYFWPHARAALRLIGLSDRHRIARRVLKWMAATQPAEFSVEDIRRRALGKAQDAEQTRAVIDALVKAGWCREVTAESAGGRPARRWAPNPRLWDTL